MTVRILYEICSRQLYHTISLPHAPICLLVTLELIATDTSQLRSREGARILPLATCLLSDHKSSLVATTRLALYASTLGSLPLAPHGTNGPCYLARSIRLRDGISFAALCRQLDLAHIQRLADQQSSTIHGVLPNKHAPFCGALPLY